MTSTLLTKTNTPTPPPMTPWTYACLTFPWIQTLTAIVRSLKLELCFHYIMFTVFLTLVQYWELELKNVEYHMWNEEC